MPRNKAKNLARAAAHRAERRKDAELTSAVGVALCGSERVHKAISSTDYKMCLRVKSKEVNEGICLPDVALYQAGHRKVRKDAVHITK